VHNLSLPNFIDIRFVRTWKTEITSPFRIHFMHFSRNNATSNKAVECEGPGALYRRGEVLTCCWCCWRQRKSSLGHVTAGCERFASV